MARLPFFTHFKEFQQLCRTTHESFEKLVAQIQDDKTFQTSSQSKQCNPAIQLAVALSRLGSDGNGAALGKIGMFFGISHGAIVLQKASLGALGLLMGVSYHYHNVHPTPGQILHQLSAIDFTSHRASRQRQSSHVSHENFTQSPNPFRHYSQCLGNFTSLASASPPNPPRRFACLHARTALHMRLQHCPPISVFTTPYAFTPLPLPSLCSLGALPTPLILTLGECPPDMLPTPLILTLV
ncbi:hypothetical protein O181_025213 [Austropuccinia psidii MF-1]|uniref:Uncharacterized protein n=1 Tax=Austropuccinia psidii MF-1 TaxID=1389203 RepID=A0A9Q3GYW6_9BASI|nr:hypothetical protein [Austropuccinia psidii MF-1]